MPRPIIWSAHDIRVDLGGGLASRPGHFNVDLISEADIIFDLNNGLPPEWPEDSIDAFFASHLIEHLDSVIRLMNDVYRTLKPGGVFEGSTPYAGTPEYWQDPTHEHGFVENSFAYFVENSPFKKEQAQYGITARFVIHRAERGTGVDAWQLFFELRKQPRRAWSSNSFAELPQSFGG